MATTSKIITVKDTAFGQDMLEVLAERQLEKAGFRGLDISTSILTLKEYLVKKLSHGNWRVDPGHCQPELRYLYPIYFDSARVLLAECVAEFFQTGRIYMAVLDPYRMEYAEHEIRLLILRPEDVSSLLRALRKVHAPGHDLIARWKNQADQERWLEHLQTLQQAISKLQ
ncbi:hypothetical protein I5Q82_02335 [Acutalibacter muris]|uniref:Uncharacterized protein n=1 Tax=Acutalibacter muris TaxID=1796620 RepID=A0A1Z2XSH0_9FIRM|nr:hypothetical protein [Acutalibacter muris]ANU55442.1 hypothetical protein A4V00_16290 [Hungateiclostridiaceae bacterium KB18]ASB41321.1 hypothetical protein ADH66_12025 [Acutalibacter muris]QQR30588.1 hypothetical protein I5Q82_02335 [Acutalibacter muris]